jgi:hypothetical protein
MTGGGWTGLLGKCSALRSRLAPTQGQYRVIGSEAICEHGAHGVEVEVHIDSGFALGSACRVIDIPGFAATLDVLA